MGGYFLGQSKQNKGSLPDRDLGSKNIKIVSVSGTVIAIDGSLITLKTADSEEKIIEIGGQTKIYVQEYKTTEQYQKEMEEYLSNSKKETDTQSGPPNLSLAPAALNLSPEIFAKKPGSLADIKIGVLLNVIASEDIKTVKRFKAAQIIIPPPAIVPAS